jgi:hypothetical protein
LLHISPNLWNIDEKLNDQDNDDLTRPFTVEEVKSALFSLNTNRAPVPDDIPVEFYQSCWKIVKMM